MKYKILQKLFLIICLMMTVYSVNAQFPLNYVPNYSFESGKNGQEPNCWTDYHPMIPDDINDYLEYWYTADHETGGGIFGTIPTPDWIGPNCIEHTTACYYISSLPVGINRYVGLADATDDDLEEGVRAHLNWRLQANKSYFLRMKMMGNSQPNGVRVHFTEWGPNWGDDDDDNTRFIDAANVGISGAWGMGGQCKWYTVEKKFDVPNDKGSDLANMIIMAGGGADRYALIDDVELFEYCPEWMIRQKRDYHLYGEREEATNIYAGNSVNTSFPTGDVNMYINSIVTYKAGNEVILQQGVNIERGADFTAKIAPCGRECPLLDVGAGPQSFDLCNGLGSMTIGFPSGRNQSYTWTADNPAHLAYLSSTTISNPVFTAPANTTEGIYKYYLTVTNLCGESTTVAVMVRFSQTTNPNPVFSVSNLNISNTENPSLTIQPGPNTEKVIVELIKCNGDVVTSGIYYKGIDYTTNIAWSYSEFQNPCDCFKIRIKSKNYCFENWYTQEYSWTRPTNFGILNLPNVTSCVDGQPTFCIEAAGTSSVHLDVLNRWGDHVYNEIKPYSSDPLCFTLSGDLSSGTYYGIISFTACDGSAHDGAFTITVLDCYKGIVGTLPKNCTPQVAYANIPVKLQSESGVFTDHQVLSDNEGVFAINTADLVGHVNPQAQYRVAALYPGGAISYGNYASFVDLTTTLQAINCPPVPLQNILGMLQPNCQVGPNIMVQLQAQNGTILNYVTFVQPNGQFMLSGAALTPYVIQGAPYRLVITSQSQVMYGMYMPYQILASQFQVIGCSPAGITGSGGNPTNLGTPDEIAHDDTGIKLYPNPVNSMLNINTSDHDIRKIIITDLVGKMIMNVPYTSSPIDISDIPSGMYHIELKDENNKMIHQQKLIIIHE